MTGMRMLREESWLAAPIALASLATAFAQFVERGFLARYSDAAVALVLGFTPSVVALYLTMPLWLAVGAVAFAVRWRGERWRNRARV